MSTSLDVLTLRELSTLLGVKEVTLRSWRHRGYGPRSFKIGATVVYDRKVVEAFIASRQEKTA